MATAKKKAPEYPTKHQLGQMALNHRYAKEAAAKHRANAVPGKRSATPKPKKKK